MTGSATHAVVLKLRQGVGRGVLQARPDDLDITDGEVTHRDRSRGPTRSLGSWHRIRQCSATAPPRKAGSARALIGARCCARATTMNSDKQPLILAD
jgi:hypothetical protein